MELNIYLPYDQAILLLGIYPKRVKTCLHKNLYLNISNSFIHHQKLKTTQVRIN